MEVSVYFFMLQVVVVFSFHLLVVVVSKYVARRSIKAGHSCKKGHRYFFQVFEALLASTSALTYTTFS